MALPVTTQAMTQRNPFDYGRELDRTELVGRTRELTEIRRAIRNRGRLFLVGPRRFGKTSLLAAAERDASKAGALVLRFDVEKYESLQVLAAAVLTAAARALRSPVERIAGWLGRMGGRLRPAVEVDPLTGTVSVSLGDAGGAAEELGALTAALDAVESLAAGSSREVVVILDEVQQLVVEHGEAAEEQLRATVDGHPHVAYVFAGSATRLLAAMTGEPRRPLHGLGPVIYLGALPEPELVGWLRQSFEASGFSVAEGACERILRAAGGVPYDVRRLAHEAWEVLRAGAAEPDPRALTEAVVARSLERVVRREDPSYTQIWTSLTRNQKKALKAVIETAGEGLQSAAVSRRYGISPASVQVAVAALEDRHLVHRDRGPRRSGYRLVDPFFAAWLRVFQQV